MIPLWETDSTSDCSSVFTIKPGEVGILLATGFEKYRFRTEEGGEPYARQGACVHRYFADNSSLASSGINPNAFCDYLFDPNTIALDNVWVPIYKCGKSWFIHACDNLKIIGLPGMYQLCLNDSTAIGTAQVWFETMAADKVPAAMADYFF